MVDGTPVVVYTDGGCIGNPGPGGWAAILKFGSQEKELTGKFRHTTNNRMELRAAIEALEAIKRPLHVVIFTDSTYVQNGITRWVHRWQQNNWRTAQKKPVKNRDLWQRLLAAVERHRTAGGVEWRWTKGHAGDKYNERADDLANSAARSVSDLDPLDEEKGASPPLTGSLFDSDPIN